jgi:putative addiction module component (TIGR02574 family)
MMSLKELENLSLVEKLQIMEAIWVDLRPHVETAAIPEEHRRLLDSRLERVAEGKSSIREWDEVKHSIGRR